MVDDGYNRGMEKDGGNGMGRKNDVYQSMISFYAGDPKHIQHFVKVHSFAKLIGE